MLDVASGEPLSRALEPGVMQHMEEGDGLSPAGVHCRLTPWRVFTRIDEMPLLRAHG